MSFNMHRVLKRVGIMVLVLAISIPEARLVSLADNFEKKEQEIFDNEILSDKEHDIESSGYDYVGFVENHEQENENVFRNSSVGTPSNMIRDKVIATVSTSEELIEAIAMADEGDTIEIANDIYLLEVLTINKSIILQANKNIEKVTIYSADDCRHFIVKGGEINLIANNIVLDGNGLSGGIESQAEHLILSEFHIQNCVAPITIYGTERHGGGICASGDLTITNSILTRNVATHGGGVAGYSNITILDSKFYLNEAVGEGRGFGGCIYAAFWLWPVNPDKTLEICNSEFIANVASGGGSVIDQSKGILKIINCKFIKNHGGNSGAIDISRLRAEISGCEFINNTCDYAGGAIRGLFADESDYILIENTKMYGNAALKNGGAIDVASSQTNYFGPYDDKLIISNCEIIENSSQYGGGIYTRLESLKVCNNSIIKDNSVPQAYKMIDEDDIAMHKKQIDLSTTWTDGFKYIYNNLDVSYLKGSPINVYSIEIEEIFEDTSERKLYHFNGVEGAGFHYDFSIKVGYEAVIESDVNLTINMEAGTIDFEPITSDINISIRYRPIEEYFVTITTLYSYGAVIGESVSYWVQSGESLEHTYNVLEGYQLVGYSADFESHHKWVVDSSNHKVSIAQVENDASIGLYFEEKTQKVSVIVHYLDGALPDNRYTYDVMYGEEFLQTYEILEGYELSSYQSEPSNIIIDGIAQTMYINQVQDDYMICINLAKKPLTVNVVLHYLDNALPDQVNSYEVLYGEAFLEKYEIADQYRVVGGQTEKGVKVDLLNKTIEIESVQKDISIILMCR